eukprot:Gb_09210 [translate_table: standard]
MVLPKVLPPSYRGTTVRYLYYLVVAMNWRPGNFDNGLSHNQFTKKALHLAAHRNAAYSWSSRMGIIPTSFHMHLTKHLPPEAEAGGVHQGAKLVISPELVSPCCLATSSWIRGSLSMPWSDDIVPSASWSFSLTDIP